MKYVLSLLIFMLYFPSNVAISEEKPTIEIVHDPFKTFYPHLGNNICRKKAFEIAYDKTIDKDKKTELWKSYKEICSANGSYQLILADFYISYGRNYNKAKQILEKAIDSVKYDSRYHKSLLHDIYHDLNEKSNAINLAKKIINDYPDWYGGYSDLALDFIEAKCWNTAKQYLEKALTLDDQDPRTYLLLAYVFYELREDDKALDCYHKAFLLDPYQPYLHLRSSAAAVIIYTNKGEFEVAKNILDLQQKFNPDIIKDKRFIGVKQYYENALKRHKSKG